MAIRAPNRTQPPIRLLPSFTAWRRLLSASGLLPVIAVAGSRGKSTVIRLLDTIFQQAGLRTATWTDIGVEIAGTRQRGELVPWGRAESLLTSGLLDVAIREVDWAIVPTAAIRPHSFPIVAVTNVCANRDACLIHDEAKVAIQSLPTLFGSVSDAGTLVLNGEDFALFGERPQEQRARILVAMSRESPVMRSHLETGGVAAWTEDGDLLVNVECRPSRLCAAEELRFTLGGAAAFELHNALTAAALALACGMSPDQIGRGLRSFELSPRLLPGSFNVFDIHGVTVVVDRPEPSWFLRPLLRAIRDRSKSRTITIVGQLPDVPDADLPEVGRLLGRASTALILHSQDQASPRSTSLRQGVAQNDVPPPILHTPTERRAVARALQMARPRDFLLILSDRPLPLLRTLARLGQPTIHPRLATD